MSHLTAESPSTGLSSRVRTPRRTIGRVRLRTILIIRWIAVAGQALTLLVVHYVLGFPMEIAWAGAAVAALAAVTLATQVRRPQSERLTDRESALYFAFDILQLAVLLYLTGGLNNPFSVLILAPVTVSAAALSNRSTLSLAGLAIACIVLLAIRHEPLPWPEGAFEIPDIFVAGYAIALIFAVLFLTFYVYRVAQESRRLSDALAAAQAALDREQRVSSLGALAAAAAHELGSPLGTISLVAKELARDLPTDSEHRADADLLVSQSERCREILAELSRKPDQSKDHFNVLPAGLLVELAAAPHARPHVALRIEFSPDPAEPRDPVMPRRPEIMHGLGNLLQNAIEFAGEEVKVMIAWTRAEITITITDDGPGFPPDVLRRLGDPYLSSSSGEGLDQAQRQGDHMGLGIFIAQNLIERTGGTVGFSNNQYGGAEARVSWPRSVLG
ncbi:ActS/PrrB/RegB family redox-sensitive histidine kinase [Dongia deserti]|uniref:ActS/PrrB/RegB family redox-sensitive histidine kinase n=1 Tax=Dongia deserti TaxID=2268030 RepID=UPI000E64F619|nr:ActS/PrrB/RegB family redox-sensitive histidine kinase [Dongia deserti]